jgi:cold shock CspA family protein
MRTMTDRTGNDVQESRLTGYIKVLSDRKPFGFLRVDGSKVEYFFHESDLANCTWSAIQVGQQVTFRTEDTPKGPRAREIDLTNERYSR